MLGESTSVQHDRALGQPTCHVFPSVPIKFRERERALKWKYVLTFLILNWWCDRLKCGCFPAEQQQAPISNFQTRRCCWAFSLKTFQVLRMNFSFWLDDIYLFPSKYISSATASLLATFCSFQLYAAFFSFIQYHRAPSSSNQHHPTASNYIQLHPVPASIANLLQVSSRRPSFCQFNERTLYLSSDRFLWENYN